MAIKRVQPGDLMTADFINQIMTRLIKRAGGQGHCAGGEVWQTSWSDEKAVAPILACLDCCLSRLSFFQLFRQLFCEQ
jgi:hypothetical protein